MAKQTIHWWDSPGKYSCHKNEPKLSFAESYLGEVTLAGDGLWYYKTPHMTKSPEPGSGFKNVQLAKKALLKELDAAELTTWDS